MSNYLLVLFVLDIFEKILRQFLECQRITYNEFCKTGIESALDFRTVSKNDLPSRDKFF